MKIKDFFLSFVFFLQSRLGKMRGHRYITSGRCRRCGGCCRDMQLIHQNRVITSEAEFEMLVREDPEYRRFSLCRDEDGSISFTCSLLQEDNSCSSYENRPEACRKYPDPEQIYRHGCDMIDGCGFTVRPVTGFQEILSREMRKDGEE